MNEKIYSAMEKEELVQRLLSATGMLIHSENEKKKIEATLSDRNEKIYQQGNEIFTLLQENNKLQKQLNSTKPTKKPRHTTTRHVVDSVPVYLL